MATDIIARGMAAGSVKPGSDGKIPAEYLPSYVDDIIDLVAISDTAPATCAEGDKYYNSTDKLIYTATGTNTWGTTGETPETGRIYINTAEDPSGSYRWDGLNLVLIGASGGQTIQYTEMPTPEAAIEGEIIQYIGATDIYTNGYFYKCVSDGGNPATYTWENVEVQEGGSGGKIYNFEHKSEFDRTYTSGTQFELAQGIYNDIINNRAFTTTLVRPLTYAPGYGGYRNFAFYYYTLNASKVILYYVFINYIGNASESTARPGFILSSIEINISNSEVTSVYFPYQNPSVARYLATDNWQEFNPSGNYNPATVKFVKDTATDIANKKTAMLNYEGGEHNKIYLSSDNTLTPSLPDTAVESAYHGANYTMEYTYTTAQSITPATRFSAHIVKILKTTYISAQTLTITASVVRDGTALVTKTITGPSIAQTSGTADIDTVDFDIPFDLELLEPLEIQVGDIFRVVVKCSNTGNYSSNGAIYSSSTNATYIEQYANGISAEDVYDTINGTTYTQHEINQMGGGGDAPIYLITGTTQADVDKINECCNLFTQNKPFTAYYKSTAQYGPKYVPIIFFTMGTNDIFMNFIGWAGYSGNGQTLIWGQIQGTGTPGQYSAIQITDSASNYKEVLYEGYLQNFSNYSQYKMQTFKNDNGTFIWEDDADVIAPKYSSSSTYAVGDYVMYQGKLYVCSTAISQAEDWTAAHWTQTTVAAIIGNLNTVLASLTTSNNGGN